MKNPKKTNKKKAPDQPKLNNNGINRMMKGIGVSGGVGIGQVVVIERLTTDICPRRVLKPEEIPAEIQRFESAVKDAAERLKQIKSHIDPNHPLGDHVYILDTHLLLLEDRMFFRRDQESDRLGKAEC